MLARPKVVPDHLDSVDDPVHRFSRTLVDQSRACPRTEKLVKRSSENGWRGVCGEARRRRSVTVIAQSMQDVFKNFGTGDGAELTKFGNYRTRLVTDVG